MWVLCQIWSQLLDQIQFATVGNNPAVLSELLSRLLAFRPPGSVLIRDHLLHHPRGVSAGMSLASPAPTATRPVLVDATNSPHAHMLSTPQRQPRTQQLCADSANKLLGSVRKLKVESCRKLKNWDDQMVDSVHSALGNADKAQKYLAKQLERQEAEEATVVTCETVFSKPGPIGIEFKQGRSGNVEIAAVDTAAQPVSCHWLVPELELVAVQGHSVTGMGRSQVNDLIRTAGRPMQLQVSHRCCHPSPALPSQW